MKELTQTEIKLLFRFRSNCNHRCNTSGTPDTTHSSGTTNNVVFNSGYSVPEMSHDSGDVLYVENRAPITRAADTDREYQVDYRILRG